MTQPAGSAVTVTDSTFQPPPTPSTSDPLEASAEANVEGIWTSTPAATGKGLNVVKFTHREVDSPAITDKVAMEASVKAAGIKSTPLTLNTWSITVSPSDSTVLM